MMRWPWVRRSRLEVEVKAVVALCDSLARTEKLLRRAEHQRAQTQAEHEKSLDRITFLQKEMTKADVKEEIG